MRQRGEIGLSRCSCRLSQFATVLFEVGDFMVKQSEVKESQPYLALSVHILELMFGEDRCAAMNDRRWYGTHNVAPSLVCGTTLPSWTALAHEVLTNCAVVQSKGL